MAAANPAPSVLDYALQLPAGTAAALALSYGADPAASNRTGAYADLTASAEKVVFVAGAQTGPYFQRNASTVDAYFPGAVTITGNLTVNGTTTTINSTTVEVDDRVIRVNKTTGANDPAPTNITGLSVYRGAVSSVARDSYGLFWDESATKWKLAVNTGGDDATLGAYLSLQALAITGTTITASTAFVGGTVSGTTASFSGQITSTLATGSAPFVIASTTVVGNLNVSQLLGATWAAPGTIGSGTPSTGAFTTISATGVITSTIVTGTAPFTVASATLVANLYAAKSALADTVTTNANLTGVITSVGNATSIASQTGTGTKFVVDTSPTLVTPVIGVATGTSLALSGLGTNQNITYSGAAGLLTTASGFAIVGIPSATAPSTATNGPGVPNGVTVQVGDGLSVGFNGATYGNGGTQSVNYQGYVSQGTAASPAAAILNDQAVFGVRGFDGTGWSGTAASVIARVGSTWSNTNHETYLLFSTCPNGSTSQVNAARWDSNQTLVLGGNFAGSGTFSSGTLRPHLQTASTSGSNAGIVQTLWNNGTTGPTGIFAKSRSGTPGTQGVITTGDTLGTLSWQGDDGTNFINAADIVVTCTGTIGTGQVPGIMKFRTATSAGTISQAMSIDSTQVVIMGNTSTSSALLTGGTVTPRLQTVASTAANASSANLCFVNSTVAGSLYFGKSRSGTIGTMTVVTTGDTLGNIDWQGCDGTNFVSAAKIIVTCTGTIAGSQVPGNMVIQTATTGGTLTTALTIDNAQLCTFAGGISIADAKNIALNTTTGTKIGTATTQKIGLWNVTPVVQPATTGTTTGFVAGAGTAVTDASTFTGGTGSTAYRISDIVLALKQLGAMAA